MRWFSRFWKLVSTAATVAWLLSIGGASLVTGLVGWGLNAWDVIPTPFLVLVLVGFFCLTLAGTAIVAPRLLVERFPAAAAALLLRHKLAVLDDQLRPAAPTLWVCKDARQRGRG
jgi:hypothetical protein